MDPKRFSLDELLATLPPEVEPPSYLWRRVRAGIVAARDSWKSIALAASVSCLLLAGALVWAVLHGRPAADSPASTSPAAAQPRVVARTPSFTQPSDAKYTATRAALESTFQERLAQLDPTTRTHIETSLAVIRQAHEDIRKALASAPSNPLLEQLFESTWHDEIDLYDQVVRATQPTFSRT